MQFLFLKPDLRCTNNTPHYAGGNHGFSCAAHALAAARHSVHVLSAAPKAELMFSLLQQQGPAALAGLSYSSAVEGVAVYSDGGITHHVSLSDAPASTAQHLSSAMSSLLASSSAAQLSTPYQRLLEEASALLRGSQGSSSSSQQWVVLDADGSQEPLDAANRTTLLEACCAAGSGIPPSQVLLLVQNVHFLPLGPLGTAARSPPLLRAWSQLGGVLCVSSFVARYIAQHAGPLGLPPQRIYCVHYAVFGAFGPGPFADYGTSAAQHLPWPPAQQQQQHSQPAPPTIGCLKLSPEKGGALFLALARSLPQLHFLAVCADASSLLAATAGQQQQLPPNLELVPPGDVDVLLQRMTVLLAPSVWQEAYGMVVTEAALRGVPVVVSDQGGLSESALSCAAAVVPVRPMQLPVSSSESDAAAAGTAAGFMPHPRWQDRVFPAAAEQDLSGWVQALQRLLGDRGVYEACSASGRAAGLRLVQHQRPLLDQLVAWLGQLGS